MRRLSPLLRSLAVTLGLISLPASAALAEPALCPATYWFNDPEFVSYQSGTHHYTFKFTLEEGTTEPLLPGAGRYEFGYVTADNLLATLSGVYMLTTCNRIYTLVPPYAEPQPVLVIAETDWGYRNITLSFTPPPDDSDECYWPAQDVLPGTPGGKLGAVADKVARGATLTAEKPLARPSVVNTKAPGKARTDVECGDTDPTGGGGTTPVEYCLYYEYYDEYGNFLYEELQFCWQQEQ